LDAGLSCADIAFGWALGAETQFLFRRRGSTGRGPPRIADFLSGRSHAVPNRMATRAHGRIPGAVSSLLIGAHLLALAAVVVRPALAQDRAAIQAAKQEFEGLTPQSLQELRRQYDALAGRGR